MLTTPGEPVSSSDIFAAGALSGEPAIVVGFSGGSDSLALLLLLHDHVRTLAIAPRLVAVTVDHGLRPGSAAEALQCAEVCRELGIDHVIRRWDRSSEDRPTAEAARNARYSLLGDEAALQGARLVMTGHTRDDQAETVAMRRRRGSGDGLSGMADLTLHGWRSWICRPLLAQSRSALQSLLRGRTLSWISDPTNSDRARERSRIRAELHGNTRAVDELVDIADEAGRQRTVVAGEAAHLLAQTAKGEPGMGVRIGNAFFDAPSAVQHLAFAAVAATVGGLSRLPARRHAAAAIAEGGRRFSFGRCTVENSRAGLVICREWRNLPPAMPFAPGVWDGRYSVIADGPLAGVTLRVLGPDGASAMAGREADAAVRSFWRSRAGEPWPFADGKPAPELLGPPGPVRIVPRVAPYAAFAPRFDLPLARVLAQIVAAPLPPETPMLLPGGATNRAGARLGNAGIDAYVTV